MNSQRKFTGPDVAVEYGPHILRLSDLASTHISEVDKALVRAFWEHVEVYKLHGAMAFSHLTAPTRAAFNCLFGKYMQCLQTTLGRDTVEALIDEDTCRNVYHDVKRQHDFLDPDPYRGLQENEGFYLYDLYPYLEWDRLCIQRGYLQQHNPLCLVNDMPAE
ncbi:hypothetical protein HDU87_002341 [Geranomyces variabilis]|uniref:Uncharacterized protein n=1 Tax=Geranomyces variabilis TaxID=109894 RepID=A0AAD5XHX2_9FUNG|nr:hypothetical protein HDU87_002341 [Geranomyces variabilis]